MVSISPALAAVLGRVAEPDKNTVVQGTPTPSGSLGLSVSSSIFAGAGGVSTAYALQTGGQTPWVGTPWAVQGGRTPGVFNPTYDQMAGAYPSGAYGMPGIVYSFMSYGGGQTFFGSRMVIGVPPPGLGFSMPGAPTFRQAPTPAPLASASNNMTNTNMGGGAEPAAAKPKKDVRETEKDKAPKYTPEQLKQVAERDAMIREIPPERLPPGLRSKVGPNGEPTIDGLPTGPEPIGTNPDGTPMMP